MHTQCSPAYISQRCGKSRNPLPTMYLYFSFCHFHWHEKSFGTRITFSFPMVCAEQRGSSSPKDAKCFCTFMTTDPFFHPVDPSSAKPSLQILKYITGDPISQGWNWLFAEGHLKSILLSWAYVSSTTNILVRKECCNLWLKNLLVSHLLSLLLNTMIISLVISTEENMYYD